jgi:hypothetical protein
MRRVIALGGAAGLVVATLTMNVNLGDTPPAPAVTSNNPTIPSTSTDRAPTSAGVAGTVERAGEEADRIMVRVAGDLDVWAAEQGVQVAKRPGVSGFAAVLVPVGETTTSLLDRLRATGTVDAAPIALMYGAGEPDNDGEDSTTTTMDSADTVSDSPRSESPTSDSTESGAASSAVHFQWHLAAADMRGNTFRADGVVVAVVDSGVAYLTTAEDGRSFNRAESLAGVTIVAPWDFVEDDALPLDEHQHGTHIASIIASQGEVQGIAQGVSLMPLRVLDENNAGNELDLVEALHWAIDHGADVVNMSLAFPTGYLPSPALEEALERCHNAGVVVIAATGNDGASIISWPAASPSVIAVGASAPGLNGPHPAVYSNLDPKVALLAPGGDMQSDMDQDGYPDGILAETIALNDPTAPSLWFMEGTSQAAAIVSATTAVLLAQGYAAEDVRTQLQYTVNNDFGSTADSAVSGFGTGSLSVWQATSFGDESGQTDWMGEYTVAVLPYLEELDDGGVVPHARLTLLMDGEVASYGSIHGSFWGSTESYFSCAVGRLQESGYHCDVSGQSVPSSDTAAAWLVSADLITAGGAIARPTAGAFHSDALDVVLAAMDDNPDTAGGTIGFYWEAGDTEEFGRVAEGYTVTDLGSGLLSSPMGLMVRQRGMSLPTAATLDLDGTGLLSSPMGFKQVRVLSLWGSGLISSPMGFQFQRRLVFMDGSGLLSSPMGFRSTTLLAQDPDAPTTSIGILTGSSSETRSYTSTVLDGGGWTHGPSAMVSFGATHIPDNGLQSIVFPAVPFTQ